MAEHPLGRFGQWVDGVYGRCCWVPALAAMGTRLPTMDESGELSCLPKA